MAVITEEFKINYEVNAGLVWSAEEYLVNYLTDIPLRGLGGELLTDDVIEQKIISATVELENFLSIKFGKQCISEYQDFERDQFRNWGYIKANYLIAELDNLRGQLNFANIIEYPSSWLSYDRSLEKKRNIQIVAGQQGLEGGITNSFSAIFTGQFPMWRSINSDWIPNYWYFEYVTGFDEVPADLLEVVGKMTTTQVMAILGDIAFGAGIASKSISIDGLSQSINTTQSAENSLYSARIRQFDKELTRQLKLLKNRYNAPTLMAL